MGRKNQIDPDEIREHLIDASKQAKSLADQGVEWATPRVEAAIEWAAPKVDSAWRQGVQLAAPKVEKAAAKAGEVSDVAAVKAKEVTDTAHDALVEVIIPRVVTAMQDAAKAAGSTGGGVGDKAEAAVSAATVALKGEKKSHGVLKTLGWVAAGAAVAGAGYIVWRRTQPVDDPWAEEYWEDDASEAVDAAVDSASSLLDDVTDQASDVAESVGQSVSDAVESAEGAVEEAVSDVTEAAETAVDDAKPARRSRSKSAPADNPPED